MDEPVKTDQNQANTGNASVITGGAETEPVARASTEVGAVQGAEGLGEQIQSSEVQPQVGGEVGNYVQVKKDFPEVDPEAQGAGVRESIPDVSKGVLPTDPQDIKQGQAGSSEDGKTWISFLAEKVLAFKNKFVGSSAQPQEDH